MSLPWFDALHQRACDTDRPFVQAVEEVFTSVAGIADTHPEWKQAAIFERLLLPDRVIEFKVEWIDDHGQVQVNRGYRIQYNNSLGPYKGGLRFHPSVNAGILKFLAFEQIFKNALTGLALGGAKGGSDFDPKGKSDAEIMRFCQAFMRALYPYIGPMVDVPAGDIGVGNRELGYLFAEYKRLTHQYSGVLTGKPLLLGGSILRPEATGYGVVYFAQHLLEDIYAETLTDKVCCVSGAGNVALHTIEKLQQEGALVISCSDSQGTLHDAQGIDLKLVKQLKAQAQPLTHYLHEHSHAQFIPSSQYPTDGHAVWRLACDAAFPCATQNELTLADAQALVTNGVRLVVEAANMPCTPEAIEYFLRQSIAFAPAKAANAGGVAISQLEMAQNASMIRWTYAEIDQRLNEIMRHIYQQIKATAIAYHQPNNLVAGANIAAFKRVVEAMLLEGC